MSTEDLMINRRTIVAGAGVAAAAVALAACGGSSEDSSPSPTTTAAGASPDAAGGSANVIARTTDVPVGGGAIFGDVVVTQPTAGTYLGFSPVCTHQGCKCDSVRDGTINCPCHGSAFNLDGSVKQGPATEPLAARTVRVEGDSIVAS
jgi:Rieske Fe-S protein